MFGKETVQIISLAMIYWHCTLGDLSDIEWLDVHMVWRLIFAPEQPQIRHKSVIDKWKRNSLTVNVIKKQLFNESI